jgi:cysteinyl-tRNA synthetase
MDISTLAINNGLAMTISIVAIVSVVAVFRTAAKYTPTIVQAGKEFIEVWQKFVHAMEKNASAIEKNTHITDLNHRHSEVVLRELESVNSNFKNHDDNALEIKRLVEELKEMAKSDGEVSIEVLELLNFIVRKLEREK